MKQILTILFCSILLNVAKSQISPLQTNEYCPNTEYTFTATITKPYSSMIGVGGCFVTQLPIPPVGTTFTFKGKFADGNQKQTFQINHPDGSSTPFDFKKIKSLFYSTTGCSPIQPNQTTITAPRCQISSFNISFNNIQWGTAFESPALCFGSVTTYEYLLPAGWKLGTTTSNGTIWLAGNNSVTITSDLSTGTTAGSGIRIRPSNSGCGTGLYTGQEAFVSISRPAPALSITGAQDAICSGCASYTINGMTSGATVQWSLSNTTNSSISGCTNCSTVTVCRNTSVSAVVTLTATVTDCIQTYPAVTKTISLGGPTALTGINEEKTNNGCVTETSVYTAIGGTGATNYKWYYRRLPSGSFSLRQSGTSNTYTLVQSNKGLNCTDYEIKVEATNSCITTPFTRTIQSEVCPCNFLNNASANYTLSPNPALNTLTVTALADKSNDNGSNTLDEIRIYDLQGNLKKYQKFNKAKTTAINITGLENGTYFIEIRNGAYKEKKQFLIER